jgi:hypothetical protein
LNITVEEGILEYLAASIVDEIKDIVAAAKSLDRSSCDLTDSPILDAKTWYDICERKLIEMDGMLDIFEKERNDEGMTPLLQVIKVLEKLGAVKSEPKEELDDTVNIDIEVGDRVLAILEESGEWHEAIVKETNVEPQYSKTTWKQHLVVFTKVRTPFKSTNSCL